MDELAKKECIPCQGGVPPLGMEECKLMKKGIDQSWQLEQGPDRLIRKLEFSDFKKPMDIAFKIGELAEEQWHHPELQLGWGHLVIEIWTHKINGLVESDFIFAAKVDQIISDSL